MFVRLLSCCFVLIIAVSCALIPPPYDERIPLIPDLEEDGNSVLRTQTLWTNNFDSFVIQVIQIDSHLTGVKYMHKSNFRKIREFPGDNAFGKRLFIIPPGKHNVILSYRAEMGTMLGPDSKVHSGVLLYDATVPPDSVCAFVVNITHFRMDIYNPDITLSCHAKRG